MCGLPEGGRTDDPAGKPACPIFWSICCFAVLGLTTPVRLRLRLPSSHWGAGSMHTDADSTCYYGRIHPRFSLKSWPLCCCGLAWRESSLSVGLSVKRHWRISARRETRSVLIWWWDGCSGLTIHWESPRWEPGGYRTDNGPDLKQHLATWYRPNNAAVVAAGPWNISRLLRLPNV